MDHQPDISSSPRGSYCSTDSDASRVHDLERRYEDLRDPQLSYDQDVEFHTFISTLDLVDTIIMPRMPRAEKRRSINRLFGSIKKHTHKPKTNES